MKRYVSLLLILALLLTGCAIAGETAETAKVSEKVTVTETEEPVTAPTLSPEEQLYQSLPERTRQAVELGILELSQLEDPERIVTIGEASAMLQKAYIHRTGVESKVLSELIETPEYATLTADRGWIFGVPGQVDMELTHGDKYVDYQQWLVFLNNRKTEPLWSVFDDRLGMMDIGFNDDGETFYITSFGGNKGDLDHDEFGEMMVTGSVYGPDRPTGYADVHGYAFKVFDSTNGKRFFELENGYINPMKELTVEDAAEYALIFYHYPNPMGVPVFVSAEEVGKYNEQIITPDLLTKETDLPAVSCSQLPSGWRGVVMDDMILLDTSSHLDNRVYEYEIRAVKEAGFNYIGFELDFNWLQNYFLFAPPYDSQKAAFRDLISSEDKGKLDLERLDQLDQVLAWCMKYDIHLNLRCIGVGGFGVPGDYEAQNRQLFNAAKYKDTLAANWQAIARRYADIPNEYLSFTLFTAPDLKFGQAQVKNEMLIPSLEAIRHVSPERCIIADVFNSYQDAQAFAQLGVALSYRMTKPEGIFNFYTSDYYSYNRQTASKDFNTRGKNALESFHWPYQDKTDAAALIELPHDGGSSFLDIMQIARENNVGFMLSDFGIYDINEANHPRARYADGYYHAMITDITSTVEALDCGWCFAHWYSPYGVAFGLQVMENVHYEQVEDYPYYIDQGMLTLFQRINGVA